MFSSDLRSRWNRRRVQSQQNVISKYTNKKKNLAGIYTAAFATRRGNRAQLRLRQCASRGSVLGTRTQQDCRCCRGDVTAAERPSRADDQCWRRTAA